MSPGPGAAALEHQEQRAKLAAATGRAAGRAWQQVGVEDIRGGWTAQMPRVLAVVSGAQLAAAQTSEPYLQRTLGDDDERAESDQLVPEALAGVAPDGRGLAELLMYPVWSTLHAITQGLSIAAALATGRTLLDLLVRTVVADTGRAADLLAMILRPAVTSYVRVVELPACARCIILAGREYGLSEEFRRHPRCDCTMAPVTRTHRPDPVDAGDVYQQMTPEQRHKVFGAAAVKALADGADITQVVNARRGMTTATRYGRKIQATTEGITRRGIAGQRRTKFERRTDARYATAKAPRLMPEEIYRLADDRAHAVRLLRRNGYIV
ncbi:hypothetical protein ABVG11_34295 [Streptomyces sp. HD1123-B1]|uniref:hypothetical protein n=1 Tax=Streptomyces huangiella TaxID=3228804 RepID=UPI003D7E276F